MTNGWQPFLLNLMVHILLLVLQQQLLPVRRRPARPVGQHRGVRGEHHAALLAAEERARRADLVGARLRPPLRCHERLHVRVGVETLMFKKPKLIFSLIKRLENYHYLCHSRSS